VASLFGVEGVQSIHRFEVQLRHQDSLESLKEACDARWKVGARVNDGDLVFYSSGNRTMESGRLDFGLQGEVVGSPNEQTVDVRFHGVPRTVRLPKREVSRDAPRLTEERFLEGRLLPAGSVIERVTEHAGADNYSPVTVSGYYQDCTDRTPHIILCCLVLMHLISIVVFPAALAPPPSPAEAVSSGLLSGSLLDVDLPASFSPAGLFTLSLPGGETSLVVDGVFSALQLDQGPGGAWGLQVAARTARPECGGLELYQGELRLQGSAILAPLRVDSAWHSMACSSDGIWLSAEGSTEVFAGTLNNGSFVGSYVWPIPRPMECGGGGGVLALHASSEMVIAVTTNSLHFLSLEDSVERHWCIPSREWAGLLRLQDQVVMVAKRPASLWSFSVPW